MRSQQTPLIREKVFCPEIIEPLCSDSGATSRRRQKAAREPDKKVAMCITAAGRGPATATDGVRLCDSSAQGQPGGSRLCLGDTTVLAQPVFVLEKRERPYKRQADLTLKAEHDLGVCPEKRLRSSSFTFRPAHNPSDTDHSVSEKRVRSSSFSFLTEFPLNQPALKNNVFMPSTLLEDQPNRDRTESGVMPLWPVIKPATLQPPQLSVCGEEKQATTSTVTTRCQHRDKTLMEKNKTLANKAGQPKSTHGTACVLGMETRMQRFEQSLVTHKYTTDFVFGENMERRVMSPTRPTPSPTSGPQCKRESTSTRGSCSRSWTYQKHRSHASLVESAAAYTSRPRLKYKLEPVNVITGEESERNVLQVNCKLFVFNRDVQTWTERGRGYLKVNDTASDDSGRFRSRIVMRNHGNLKLILNSKIFDDMKLERANRRCLRITATDLTDHGVKIFLVQASVKDASRLFAAIHHRLIAIQSYRAQEQEQNPPDAETDTDSHLQFLNSESEDDEDDERPPCPRRISDHQQRIRKRPALYS